MPKVTCPICGKQTDWEGNEYRPFCTERCKLLDLGAWVSGEYGLPVEPASLTDEDLAELERLKAIRQEASEE
ncbi:MAG: DNA gyrase inhibitor YacG [Blastocatellia bacterium]